MNLKTILPPSGGKVWRNSVLLLLVMVGVPMLSFLPVDSKITGRVFRDFNANGVFDTTPIEIGVAGVTVTAYTPTGTSVTATTGSDGTYSLTTVTGTKYRIEFTGLETGDFESAYGSATGNNGTSVQFAASGDVNVNLGVNYPAHYSSTTNPKVMTSGFINGDQVGTDYTTNILWSAPFNSTDTPTKQNLGTAAQYGSVWGTAYAKTSKKLYVAAFTKRNVGFGPGGPGAIYVTQTSGDVTAAAPSVFYTFSTSEVGGTASVIHGTLGDTPGDASDDNAAFDNVGKTSLGDIELSEDEKDLYVINLADRTLNKINIATKSKTTVAIPTPGSGTYSNSYRPFALKAYRGKIYVGVVMTNETSYASSTYATGTTYSNDKGVTTGMNAAVLEYNGSTFTKVLDFPLTYTKQPSDADQTGTAKAELWRPWTSTFRADRSNPYSYPQAWLTNIEFDVTGEMILGIRDRFGDQMGYNNYRPSSPVGPGGTTTYSAIAPGETLRAGKSGSTWTIEAAGVVNGVAATTSQKSQVGPGGAGKFYWGDVVGVGGNHGSSSLGGLALLAGSGKVMTTAMDPNDVFNTGGIKRLINAATITNSNGVSATAGSADDNTNGDGTAGATNGKKKGAVMYSDGVITWGKANGMGDVELLTAPAPIEIGNRIWIDKDSDGIQDGDEAGLAGVSVQLLAADGTTVIATAVTDANGNYIFSNSTTGTTTTNFIYGLTSLTANTNYSLRIQNISGASKQTALSGYSLTGADKDATTNGDTRDSDGIVSSTNATAALTTGNNGENNHSFDFGFAPVGSIGDYVWYDANHDGLQTSGELPAPNVTVTLQKSTDGGNTFTNFATTTTGSDGKYLFSDLETGSYKVIFTKPTGYDFTTKGTTASSNTDSNPDVTGASGVISINTALAAGDIGRDNLTIDAGLAVYGSLGDYVWYDTNYDGLQTTGEAVAPNVTVTLWKSTDGGTTWNKTFATAVTGADGKYLFDRLESATYKVVFTKPTGYEFTTTGTTAASGTDSNAGTTGETANVTINTALAATDIGRNNLTIDAGLVAYGSIGDYVWYDTNYDGLQTTGEAVAPNVTVTLWKSTDGGTTWNKTFATTTTGADGKYLFSGLQTATYKVVFTKPAGFEFTTQGTTASSNTDSNAGSTGESANISIDATLASGAIGRDNLTIDAGLVAYGSIGDYVWYDTNYDGLQTTGEAVVPNVTVTLWKSTDGGTTWNKTFATTTTGADGKYLFSGLQTATYKVVFTKPAGFEFTSQGTTASSNTDSNAGSTGESANISIDATLASGAIGRDNLTIDAGLVAYGSIGDYVWFDTNKDGSQTSGETAVSGVTVNLWKLVSGTTYNQSFATTVTDGNGKYTFSNLQSGTYKVQFVLPADKDFTSFQKNGIAADLNSDAGTNGLSDAIVINTTLASGNIGRDNPTIDAGMVTKGALPVTLLDFNVSKDENTSLLKWSTTAETNSAYFEVQRSTDGKNWVTLGSVLAQGESSDLHKYDFTDGNPLNGENLYRLKMVDADQTYAYSRIISIKQEVGYKLSVFPNPTSDVVKIETSTGASVQKVQVYSLIGKLVKEVVSPKDGEINVQQLPTGMYMLRITTSNGLIETRKVVIVR